MSRSHYSLHENNAATVRTVLMLLAVISQLCFILWGEGAEPLEPATGLTLWKHAFIGLFGLSGFFVLSSWDRDPDTVSFGIKRILRIAPALWCAIILVLLAGAFLTTAPLGTYFNPKAVAGFIGRAGFLMDGKAVLPGLFGEPAPNNLVFMPLWTLKYLVLCYAVVWVMGVLALTQKQWPFLLGAAGLIALILLEAVRPDVINPDSVLAHAIRCCSSFFVGMMAWRYRNTDIFNPYLVAASALLLLVALVWGGVSPVFYAILEVYLALWLAFAIPAARMMQRIPDLTLGLCLYGWPVTQALRVSFPQAGFAELIVPVIGISLVLALFSALCVELPARRYAPALALRLKGLFAR